MKSKCMSIVGGVINVFLIYNRTQRVEGVGCFAFCSISTHTPFVVRLITTWTTVDRHVLFIPWDSYRMFGYLLDI